MITLRFPALLLAAALLAFGPSIFGPFHLDDHALFSDPLVTSMDGWWRLWGIGQTRPLTRFTFWLNYQLGGRHPAGYHTVNLALHLGAVWLAWIALSRLVPRRPAAIAALWFAVHPIQAEAVCYVFARSNLLMTVLCLLALRCWTRGRFWAAAAWFASALLAKEECAAFPVLLALLHVSISRNRAEWKPIGVMLALAVAAGVRVAWVGAVTAGSGVGFESGVAPADYVASQGPVILRYLRLLLVPVGFTIEPDVGATTAWTAWLSWMLLAAAAILATRRFRRAREGFWFLAGLALLAPSSSLFPAQDLSADRRMYLPLVAFAAAAAFPLERLKTPFIAVALAAFFGFAVHRSTIWNSPRALWGEAVRANPTRVRPRIQLARSVHAPDALVVLREAAKLAPDDPAIAAELGRVLFELGQPAEALGEFGRALALAPRDARAWNNRGGVLLAMRQDQAAREDFARALALDPCLFDARLNLRKSGVPVTSPAGCRFTPEQRFELEATAK